MASTQKFTHDAMSDQNRHIDREHNSPKNKEIDSKRTYLNYSFPMEYNEKRPFTYYKKRINEVYMYGRGTKRESTAVTGCGWIVTLPKELYGFPDKEKAFFQATYDFIAERYGRENIINNSVHYDEGGLPHIHVIFSPITKLDHDIVRYKTKRTKQGIQLESGRYEYKYIHLNKNGKPADENNPETWVKLSNYAKKSDLFDEKVDCNTVLNPIELKHFHSDLQQYLTNHSVEGKVMTGKTGTNFTVKELKDFTQKTGLHFEEVKEMMRDNSSLLENFVEINAKISSLEQLVQAKEKTITSLQNQIITQEQLIIKANDSKKYLQIKLKTIEQTLGAKQIELENTKARVKELETEKEKSQSIENKGWGNSSSWGEKSQSGWGDHSKSFDNEKIW